MIGKRDQRGLSMAGIAIGRSQAQHTRQKIKKYFFVDHRREVILVFFYNRNFDFFAVPAEQISVFLMHSMEFHSTATVPHLKTEAFC